jgi:ribosomal protein S18 acetylase RimI-like enzyme
VPWTIEPLPKEGPRFEGALAVYREAFSRPPYSDRERANEVRKRIASQHGSRPGFRALCALHSDGRVIGMAYGYRSEPGQWWHEAVSAVVSAASYRRWMTDAWELAEIAVAPAYQSMGIGRALIDRLLEDVSEATCVLSTQTNSRAHELYERAGFQVFAEMRFVTGGKMFYVMGKELREPAGAALTG